MSRRLLTWIFVRVCRELTARKESEACQDFRCRRTLPDDRSCLTSGDRGHQETEDAMVQSESLVREDWTAPLGRQVLM